MVKLTRQARNKLKNNVFGIPNKIKSKRGYPINDVDHAINAKGRATQEFNKGKMSKSLENKIDRKANRLLGKKKINKIRKIKG
jgi:hypothetical protein